MNRTGGEDDWPAWIRRSSGLEGAVRGVRESENGSDRPVDSRPGSGNHRGNEHGRKHRKSMLSDAARGLRMGGRPPRPAPPHQIVRTTASRSSRSASAH